MAVIRFVEDDEIDFDAMHVNRYAQEHRETAQNLRDNPGKLGVVKENLPNKSAYKLAAEIRSGEIRAFAPAGDFEAKSMNGTVYARFVGQA